MDLNMEEIDGRLFYKEIKYLRSKLNVPVFSSFDIDLNEFRKICPPFCEEYLIRKPVRISYW